VFEVHTFERDRALSGHPTASTCTPAARVRALRLYCLEHRACIAVRSESPAGLRAQARLADRRRWRGRRRGEVAAVALGCAERILESKQGDVVDQVVALARITPPSGALISATQRETLVPSEAAPQVDVRKCRRRLVSSTWGGGV